MCSYKLYIYDGCGHSLRSAAPMRRCQKARKVGVKRGEEGVGMGVKGKGKQRAEEEVAVRREEEEEEHVQGQREVMKSDKHDKHDSAVPSEWGRSSLENERRRSGEVEGQGEREPEEESHGEAEAEAQQPHIPHPSTQTPTHSTPASTPQTCPDILTHPFISYMIHTLCPTCNANRDALLSSLQDGNTLQFEDWRWKVKYLSPTPEEARYTRGTGSQSPGWGELMGSWVRGKALPGLEGILGSGMGGGGGRGRGYGEGAGSMV